MFNLFEEVPETLEDLEYHIAREGLEYADNLRVAKRGDSTTEAEYHKAVKRGCCGYFDTTTKINGVVYLIGCNYGH